MRLVLDRWRSMYATPKRAQLMRWNLRIDILYCVTLNTLCVEIIWRSKKCAEKKSKNCGIQTACSMSSLIFWILIDVQVNPSNEWSSRKKILDIVSPLNKSDVKKEDRKKKIYEEERRQPITLHFQTAFDVLRVYVSLTRSLALSFPEPGLSVFTVVK